MANSHSAHPLTQADSFMKPVGSHNVCSRKWSDSDSESDSDSLTNRPVEGLRGNRWPHYSLRSDACCHGQQDTLQPSASLTQQSKRRVYIVASAFQVVLIIGLAANASAQSLKSISYAAFVAGQSADLITTHQALSSGLAVEGNPILGSSFGSIATRKTVLSAGILFACWRIDQQHPKTAAVIRIALGGFGLGVAVHNAQVSRAQR